MKTAHKSVPATRWWCQAAHVMASVRNLTISIHRLAGAVNIAKALRHAMRNPNIAREFTQL